MTILILIKQHNALPQQHVLEE